MTTKRKMVLTVLPNNKTIEFVPRQDERIDFELHGNGVVAVARVSTNTSNIIETTYFSPSYWQTAQFQEVEK